MPPADSDPQVPPRPTALAQQILKPLIREGDLVIDATAGNGHDTLFLAGCVGVGGRVLAFDVQAEAIEAARVRVASGGLLERVCFFQQSHISMADHAAEGSVAAVMFNLGYLPGSAHETTTGATTTVEALDHAVRLIRPGGALSVVCYPGHPGGDAEAAAVELWIGGLAAGGWRVARYGALATRRPAPFLLVAGRAAGR